MAINEDGIDEAVPSLALLINTARHDAELSIRELARRADVAASQITRIEKQEILRPSPESLIAIARALGKPAEPLLYLAGHIADEEFDELTADWRWKLEEVETALSVVESFRKDGSRHVSAQGAFFGPGVAEIAVSLLSLGGRQDVRELRDLVAMWQALTSSRRRLLLAFAADQERLSQQDRISEKHGRYRVNIELEEP